MTNETDVQKDDVEAKINSHKELESLPNGHYQCHRCRRYFVSKDDIGRQSACYDGSLPQVTWQTKAGDKSSDTEEVRFAYRDGGYYCNKSGDQDGEYVRASDYEALLAQNAALGKELGEAKHVTATAGKSLRTVTIQRNEARQALEQAQTQAREEGAMLRESMQAVAQERDRLKSQLKMYADNDNSILTRHILMKWDRDKIERFSLHLLGDEWQEKVAATRQNAITEVLAIIKEKRDNVTKTSEQGYHGIKNSSEKYILDGEERLKYYGMADMAREIFDAVEYFADEEDRQSSVATPKQELASTRADREKGVEFAQYLLEDHSSITYDRDESEWREVYPDSQIAIDAVDYLVAAGKVERHQHEKGYFRWLSGTAEGGSK